MKENFKAIHKILSELEKAMDNGRIEKIKINAEAVELTENRWNALMKMLYDNNYIEGIKVKELTDRVLITSIEDTRITLKGLEYLKENSAMRKFTEGAKAVVDVASSII